MAKYTSDTNLIKGAATAYRNYDNAAGMYSGLDKVTQAGMGVVDEAVKGYEAEQEKLEKEAKEAQAKADKLNDNWNTLASGVYESAGSFMKDVEYKDTVASVKALRQEYIDAQNSKDAEKMAEVKIKFNNMNAEISAHKEFRAKLTHPEYGMSDFVTGDNREYMNGFINEDYVIGRNDKKEKTYTVNGVTKTMEQINKMVDVKNMKPYADYGKLVNDYSTSKTKGNKNNLLLSIRNGIVPDQENPLRAFLNDKGFGNGQTFSDLLSETGNRASIEKEIMNTAFNGDGGGISDPEYKNFINAIVNPDNEFWKNNGGASAWKDQSRTIATELLANGAENAWDTNPDNKPDPTVTDLNKDGLRNNGWGSEYLDTQGDGSEYPSARVPWNVMDTARKSLLSFEDFGGVHYDYKYEDVGDGKMQWKAYDGDKFIKDLTMKKIAKIEGLLKPNEKDWSRFNEKRVQEKAENVEANTASIPGGFTLASLQTNSLSEITRSLQNTFDADFKENYNIENVMEMDSAGLNPGLKPVGNKIKITSKDGTFSKEYDIGPNATQEIAAQINIDFADNLLQTQEPE